MLRKNILIVDDEQGIRDTLEGIFQDEDYNVTTASNGEEGITRFGEQTPDLVLLDIWLPGIDGIETLTKMNEMNSSIPVIMISGHGNIELAIKSTRLGAYDFLEKPLSLEKVLLVANRALQQKALEEENRELRTSLSQKWQMIGSSPAMQQINSQIKLAASSSSRVLILGESGTGKELAARLLHEGSDRKKESFIEVNCAAIPQELIESELFGHEKGSFTGATDRKIGKFELADKGTLFLDEIGDMTLQTQAKVLRIIETQEFQRVGGSKNIKVDTRIIAATNKDLAHEARNNRFREDLYFRLNVIPIKLPPLRERRQDIHELVAYFVERFYADNGMRPKSFSDEAVRLLAEHNWPGNIRELRNAVERLLIMSPDNIIGAKEVEGLGFKSALTHGEHDGLFCCLSLKDAKEAFEKEFIKRKLMENSWNVSRTSDAIGLERSNLHKKIKAYDIIEPTN
ncbi:MAG: sigma-54 dependent transcriptional regulator [Dissulfurispiraceae bacterium]|jgi:two-component system nitrogen regulation response regulator NtrX|nr:sigma-54 dependent transcriptional regulator [Dissulfurispiraceae bacterium]